MTRRQRAEERQSLGVARFVDGIGPPLEQLEQDYQEILDEAAAGSSYAMKHQQTARDVLALIAEIRRLS